MITLLIIAHQQSQALATYLPGMLAQTGVDYEVVVVDMNSDDDTLECLKSIQEIYPHLHYLSLPTSARDISRERLAIHLGMRAANYPHVIVLSATTVLPNTTWLSQIESRWRPDCDILLIPYRRQRTKGWYDYINLGHEAWQDNLCRRQARSVGIYQLGTSIVGINKDKFLKYNAPAHHLALKHGTLEIFVSQFASKYNAMRINEESLCVIEDTQPLAHQWKQKRIFDVETSQHLPMRSQRRFVYLLHCLCTLHRGSLIYSVQDMVDHLRWLTTSKSTFIKKHY